METLERDQLEISSSIRIEAENNRLGNRGGTFFTDFVGGAVETDLSRLGYEFWKSGSLPQSHIELTTPVDRFFDTRAAKKGVAMSAYRSAFEPGSEQYFHEQELLGPRGSEVPSASSSSSSSAWDPPKLPAKHANQLGGLKRNTMGRNISAPLKAPFGDISAGISVEHKVAAAREVALSTRSINLGRLLAFVKHIMLSSRGTPMDGNCLYHAVSQELTGTTSAQDAAALRAHVVDWALDGANLQRVTDYAEERGVSMAALINTLVHSGNWGGPAGDLAPMMVASALGMNIEIGRPGELNAVVVLCPLSGPSGTTVRIDLADSHYSSPKASGSPRTG
jgi:hypothetical protein